MPNESSWKHSSQELSLELLRLSIPC